MNTLPSSHAQTCPACGQPNGCAVASGGEANSCWCMQVQVSRTALDRLPAQERGRRCICPACARTPDTPAGEGATPL